MSQGPYRWNSNELALFLEAHRMTTKEFAELVGKDPRTIQYVLSGKSVSTRLGTLRTAEKSFEKAGLSKSAIDKIFTRRVK